MRRIGITFDLVIVPVTRSRVTALFWSSSTKRNKKKNTAQWSYDHMTIRYYTAVKQANFLIDFLFLASDLKKDSSEWKWIFDLINEPFCSYWKFRWLRCRFEGIPDLNPFPPTGECLASKWGMDKRSVPLLRILTPLKITSLNWRFFIFKKGGWLQCGVAPGGRSRSYWSRVTAFGGRRWCQLSRQGFLAFILYLRNVQ